MAHDTRKVPRPSKDLWTRVREGEISETHVNRENGKLKDEECEEGGGVHDRLGEQI